MRGSDAIEGHTDGVIRSGTTNSARRSSLFVTLLLTALWLNPAGAVPAAPAAQSVLDQRAVPAQSVDIETAPHTLEEGQVIRLYQAVLDRSPDKGGFGFWVRRLRTGSTIEEVAADFVASREFSLVYGEPDDDEFIDLLYRNVLNREPDAAGRGFWIDQLAGGLSRVRIVVLFSESSEFVGLSNTGLVLLPPFSATISTVTAVDLGSSWRPGCPVGPEQLRRLDVSIVDFNGAGSTGTLILHEDVAEDVATVFGQLYAARYPVDRMVPVDQHSSDDLLSMDANNTSNFNCRAVTGGTGWSRHAFGRAIDINPIQNPYVTSSRVLPPQGAYFVDRTVYHPAMIYPDDIVVNAFASIGWRWGGDFNSIKDWHHFDTQ